MGHIRGRRSARKNAARLADHRAPDVDRMLDRVQDEARRRDEQDEPLPYEPADRDIDGPTDGERRRQPGKDAGEEKQDPGDGWEGA